MTLTAQSKFRLTYGSHALNLAATLRKRDAVPIELLATPDDAVRWFREAGVLDDVPHVSADNVAALRELREAIFRIGHAAIANAAPAKHDIRILNEAARCCETAPQLGADWTAHAPQKSGFAAAIAAVARDAIAIFADGSLRRRLRVCEYCPSLFIDRSRGERRRWCSMARCGNRAKVAAYRQRQKDDQS